MPDNDELTTPEKVKTSSVHLKGELSRPPSRALWLLKWLMALPHYIVLVFLSLAAVIVVIVAFFAIIFTGRYPKRLFDFVVGVFRWGWRVGFYAFVGGTDKYPPFSLKSRDDYPADFHVDYSERLSQWKPLVKWFLAIPHYFVLIAFFGFADYSDIDEKEIQPFQNMFSIIEVQTFDFEMQDALVAPPGNLLNFSEETVDHFDKDKDNTFFPGLAPILILIALIALLFTGRYHKDIFRLIIGIYRWSYRVNAYVLLLTDEYPHFRLMD